MDDLRNLLKLGAPLAGVPWHAGFFPVNKFSTVPLLMKRHARPSQIQTVMTQKRFMILPDTHVLSLRRHRLRRWLENHRR